MRRLGDAEINHFGHAGRARLVDRHQDVRWLDVTTDDSLLMRLLDRLADPDEQLEPFFGGNLVLIAKLGDLDAAHQFHDEVRPPVSVAPASSTLAIFG